MTSPPSLVDDQWELVRQFLPADLDQDARAHGAMRRRRGQLTSAEQLLRVLLLHVAGGLSLEQTVARAKLRGLATLNAMALHKRLCSSGPWLCALTQYLLRNTRPLLEDREVAFLTGRRLRILDATTISEPGSTGTDWRLHYSLCLPELCCDFLELTDPSQGESVRRLNVCAGDLLLLGRVYNDRKAIAQVLDLQASFIMRYHSNAFPLMDRKGRALDPLPKLRQFRIGESCEIQSYFVDPKDPAKTLRPVRLCALRKSHEATLRSQRKMERKVRGKKDRIRPGTLEYAHYLIVLTDLSSRQLPTRTVLEFHRARWQVELAFKRLKTLLELGQLPKKKAASSIAWMQGKILCALLIEAILCEARKFSPWGYPLR